MKMISSLAQVLLLAEGATACDEHAGGDCGKHSLRPRPIRNKCRYRVKDQLIKVIHPGVYETNIGPMCNFADEPAMFSKHCQECSSKHKPCNNSHAACGGCDCGHQHMDDYLKKYLAGLDGLKTHHTCDGIKNAFKRPNYNTLACEEGDDDADAGSDVISAELVEDDPHYNDSVLESGLVYGSCTVHPHQIRCRRVPFILKFECDDCINKGSPKMLRTCCERCKSFVDSLADNKKIPGTTLPLAFCSGCDSKFITFEDSSMPGFPPAPWDDHKRFEQYTEKLALQRQDQYLEDNICAALTPHCSEGNYKADECFAGTCTPEKRRLSSTNSSLTNASLEEEEEESCENSTDLETWLASQNRSETTSKPDTTLERDPLEPPSTTAEPLGEEPLIAADGCFVFQPSILAISIVASVFVC